MGRVRNSLKAIWRSIKPTITIFSDLRITRMSAALAYYTVFSIAPMLIVVIKVLNFFYGQSAAEGTIYRQLRSYIGESAALQIQEVIRNAHLSGGVSWASAIGIIALIFSATVVFAEIQDAINGIWRLKAKPKTGIIKMLINRLLSFSMVVGLGFIALVSLVLNAILDAIADKITNLFPAITFVLAYTVNFLLTFAAVSLLFAIIFKVLPDAKVLWKDVMVGAITTAALFMIGKFAIGFYLSKTTVSNSYGAAGSVIVILLWVYYSSIILYFGAAFTRVYVQNIGRNIYPNEYAVFIEQVVVENTGSLQAQAPTPIVKEKH